ncbi:Holliday junction resolvase RuvX [Candidatus Shapirobacteria bacterium]|nr:Holliday junction resolvase RuvX [Candidatus Shapirobacteria bacterium]
MNFLGIDYGTKHIGLALAVSEIINTIPSIENNSESVDKINKILIENRVDKIFVGLSVGRVAQKTLEFIKSLRSVIKLPIETVEESVSTIEAAEIYKRNLRSKKFYKKQIDSIAAAVILNRVISSN